jgi:hypothetical protein
LTLNATNIVNRGRISVSFWGDLSVSGQQVDLTRSTLTTLNRQTLKTVVSPSSTTASTWPTRRWGRDLYWGYWNTAVDFGAFATPKVVKTSYPTATNAIVVTNILADIDISDLASIDRVPADLTANPRGWVGDNIKTAGNSPVPALAYVQTNQRHADQQPHQRGVHHQPQFQCLGVGHGRWDPKSGGHFGLPEHQHHGWFG